MLGIGKTAGGPWINLQNAPIQVRVLLELNVDEPVALKMRH